MARPSALAVLFIIASLSLPLAGDGPASAEPSGKPEITVACDDSYPPYAFRDQDGKLVGILPDQWKEWSKATGIGVRFIGLPWAEAQRKVVAGEIDVLETAFKTRERELIYDFTPPYAQIDVPVFIHSSVSGIRSTADLQGFRVAVKKGDAAVGQLKEGGVWYIEEYPDYASIVEAARRLEVRIFCVDKPPALYYLYKNGIDHDFRIAFYLKSGAFRRAVIKGRSDLLDRVEKGFAAIPAATYERIDSAWLGASLASRVNLRAGGIVVGSLAAIVLALIGIAWILRRRVAAATSELRSKIGQLEKSEAKNRAIIAALPDLCFIVDREGRYLDYSAPDPALLALPPEAFIGKTLRELDFPLQVTESFETAIAKALDSDGMEVIQYQLDMAGQAKSFECRIVPLADDQVLAIARDMTEQKRQAQMLADSLAEKEVLLKEVHHRVKNNMQLISSLLALESKSFRDEEDSRRIVEAQQRIHSIARLHEMAYGSPDLASIGLVEYLETLARGLSIDSRAKAIEVRGPRELRIPASEAVPLGLIANELVTNAIKYGLGPKGESRIVASVSEKGGQLLFSVEDDGPGLPAGVDPESSPSMGFLLIRSLTAQLDGRISFSGPPGLRVEIECRLGEIEGAKPPPAAI
jgi:two-component sensor histidine kinase/ABC-type amino acid transport substrate-binding protein